MRPFNRSVIFEVKNIHKEEASTKKKKTINQVERHQWVQMFANHCDQFNSGVACVCNEKYQQLLDFISGDKNKISRVDLDAQKEKYSKGV